MANGAVADSWRAVKVGADDLKAAVIARHTRGANIVERSKVRVEGMEHAAVVGTRDAYDVFKVGKRRSEVVCHERQGERRDARAFIPSAECAAGV